MKKPQLLPRSLVAPSPRGYRTVAADLPFDPLSIPCEAVGRVKGHKKGRIKSVRVAASEFGIFTISWAGELVKRFFQYFSVK
jgi:hypothetical protein